MTTPVKPRPGARRAAASAAGPAAAAALAEPVRPRGRPRSPQARAAILRAARELLDESGLGAVTMEAVAERAGVGKPTVYRWWPNRHAVAMAALMEAPAESAARTRTRSPLRALQEQLLAVSDTLASRQGRSVTAMIASADPDTEIAKAFRHQFVLERRNEGRALLLRAAQAGELRAGIDLEAALDQLYGALFFRVLLGHAPADAAFVRALLDQVVRGLG